MRGRKTIEISVPHDSGSDGDGEVMRREIGDVDDVNAEAQERLADCAEASGLTFDCVVDFGARWHGTRDQVSACVCALPGWAYYHEV